MSNVNKIFYNSKKGLFFYKRSKNRGLYNFENIIIDKYFINKNSCVLDIGCGSGREAFALAEKGFYVVGIDFSRVAIEEAKKFNNNKKIEFYELDARNLPFGDNKFEYAIMIHSVLPVIPKKLERIKVLKEVCRVIKPGGILIITVSCQVNMFIKILLESVLLLEKLFYIIFKKFPLNHCPEVFIYSYYYDRNLFLNKNLSIVRKDLIKHELKYIFATIRDLNFYFNLWWCGLKRKIFNLFCKHSDNLEPGDVIVAHGEFQHHYPSLKKVFNEINKTEFRIIESVSFFEILKGKKNFLSKYIDGGFCLVLEKPLQ